jgi:2-dehydro-3-deoxyphosphogluconate aldolase/(4S)-4-hydroxy-2-oxoglutarate aldolase
MANYTRLEVYNAMLSSGLVPLFYHPDIEIAKEVVKACQKGGAKLIEITNRGDMAFPVFTQLNAFIKETKSSLILGVGSVVDAPTAALYINHGVNFVVSPILNPEVARVCNRRKVPYIPGCGSATEISEAEELGAEIIKIFPGNSVGGPEFVKALLGPMPWSRILPTGGVEATQESISAWIKAGAACLGMGSNLTRKEWIANRDFVSIENTVRQVLQWIEAARAR